LWGKLVIISILIIALIVCSIMFNKRAIWFFKMKESAKHSEAMVKELKDYYYYYPIRIVSLNLFAKLIRRKNNKIISWFTRIIICIESTILILAIIFFVLIDQSICDEIIINILLLAQLFLSIIIFVWMAMASSKENFIRSEEKNINIIYNNLQQIKSNANKDNTDEDTTNSNS